MSIERPNLFVPNKINYIKGDRPNVPCILCGVVDQHPQVVALEIHRGTHFIVCANLYPYNPGHLMVFPIRHVETPLDLTDEEALELHQLQKSCLSTLNDIYQPHAYNVGYNIGAPSGASIMHLHLHIVPRYRNEIGFLDVLAGTRPLLEDPTETVARLKERFTAP